MEPILENKLATYKPSDSTVQLIESTPILLLVGPTGAGKDFLKEKLLTTGKYHHIVSHTTRPPRINHGVLEQDGKEYHFIDANTAEKMIDEKQFIEAKIVHRNHLYGTSVAEIKNAHNEGLIAMTDLEVQGVAEYKALDQGVIAVFLLPPDFKTWQERLSHRYGEVVDVADHKRRLQTALDELDQLLNTNYYVAVINDDINETFEQISTIVSSKDHTSVNEPRAREVASRLAEDIKAYLEQSK